MSSVEKWDILMNFYGQNGSVLCHVPKGMLVFLDLLRENQELVQKVKTQLQLSFGWS